MRLRGLCKLFDGTDWQGKTGSCSGGQGLVQESFNPITCWWVGLYSLPGSCLATQPWGLWGMLLLLLSHFSRVQLFKTPWTVLLGSSSMGFSRQEHWSGVPLPSPLWFYGRVNGEFQEALCQGGPSSAPVPVVGRC